MFQYNQTLCLLKSLSNNSELIFIKCEIYLSFSLKDLFIVDNLIALGRGIRSQVPFLIKGLLLTLHGIFSFMNFECLFDTWQLKKYLDFHESCGLINPLLSSWEHIICVVIWKMFVNSCRWCKEVNKNLNTSLIKVGVRRRHIASVQSRQQWYII